MKVNLLKEYCTKTLLLMTLGILFIVIYYFTNFSYKFLKNVKVTEVKLIGELKFLEPEDIYKVINSYLDTSFYSLDLDKIKYDLEKLAWLQSATITRKWPASLSIEAKEKKPLALLQSGGIVSFNGRIFYPVDIAYNLNLPKFIARKEFLDEFRDKYFQILSVVEPLGFRIKELELMSDGGFRSLLDHDINLYLGSYELDDRLENFATAFSKKLKDSVKKISYIDLRYTNGIAVGWK